MRRRAARRILVLALLVPILAPVVSPCRSGESPEDETVREWLSSPQVVEPPLPSSSSPPRSVILLHGFGGSPYDVKPLADGLRGSGFRLVIPVVPGETGRYSRRERETLTPEDMTRWLSRLVEEEAARSGRRPFLVGFSMGGTLATIEGAKGGVDRLVLVSPYYSLPWGNGFLEKLSKGLAAVIPFVPKPWKGKVNDPEGYRKYHPGSYRVSLKAFERLQNLARQATALLSSPAEFPPTLVLASPDDEVASFEVTEGFFKGREGTSFLTFPGSDHILFYDHGAEEAVEAVRMFLTADHDSLPGGKG